MINFLALLGWNPGGTEEIFSLDELIKEFSLGRIQKGGAVFDTEKLDWLQGQWMRKMPPEEFAERIRPVVAGEYQAAKGDGDFGGDGDGSGPNATGDGQDDWRVPGDTSGASPHPGAGAMAVADGSLTNADYFPTISDPAGATGPGDSGEASLLLAMVLAPLPPAVQAAWSVPAGTTLIDRDFDPAAGGDGLAFANVIGGALAPYMRSDLFGPGLDVRLDFEVGPSAGAEGWQIDGDDPVQFGILPEPTTLGLLGIGLVGLGFRARHRRK
jgi:hypothetical protein